MKNSARFLLPEPPERAEHIEALLCDREDEMAIARAQFDSARAEQVDRPLAFVGLARVGKSHLLRKLRADVGDQFDAVVDLRISTGLSDGRAVHREMLQQTYAAIHNAALERGLAEVDGGSPLETLESILAAYEEAVDGAASSIDLTRAQEVASRVQTTRTLTPRLTRVTNFFGAAPLSLARQASEERKASAQRRIAVPPLGESMLAELTGMAHVLVHQAHPTWRTLLVIDLSRGRDYPDAGRPSSPRTLSLRLGRASLANGLGITHRASRKARSLSGGLNRPGLVAAGVVRASARSLMVMSAWR